MGEIVHADLHLGTEEDHQASAAVSQEGRYFRDEVAMGETRDTKHGTPAWDGERSALAQSVDGRGEYDGTETRQGFFLSFLSRRVRTRRSSQKGYGGRVRVIAKRETDGATY